MKEMPVVETGLDLAVKRILASQSTVRG